MCMASQTGRDERPHKQRTRGGCDSFDPWSIVHARAARGRLLWWIPHAQRVTMHAQMCPPTAFPATAPHRNSAAVFSIMSWSIWKSVMQMFHCKHISSQSSPEQGSRLLHHVVINEAGGLVQAVGHGLRNARWWCRQVSRLPRAHTTALRSKALAQPASDPAPRCAYC